MNKNIGRYFVETKWFVVLVGSLFIIVLWGGYRRFTHREWYDNYEHDNFFLHDREAIVVKPTIVPNGKWIVRPAFLGAFPYVDDSLLNRGWHVAYYDVTHEYGNSKAQSEFEDFVRFCKRKYKLHDKFVLEGFSRGGFFALCYAINHPRQVDKIYVDAPVCNLKSWPLNEDKGLYEDAARKWKMCGVNIDSVFNFPINHFDTIMKYHIPVMLVYGGRDSVVPYRENFGLINLAGYKGIYKISKPYCGHHPHSMQKCKQIVDFLDK